MEDLNDLALFAAVVTHGSFSAAARACGLPKSTLSRRVAALEERLGLRLLQRSTRVVHVTDLGAAFFRQCEAMTAAARAAYELAEQAVARPQGRVRLSCPAGLAQIFLAPILPGFMAAHPDVQLDLELTNRPVDVIAEGFDAALRVRSTLADSDLVLRPFGISPQVLVASPGFIAVAGPFAHPADLAGHPGLGPRGPGGQAPCWSLRAPDGAEIEIPFQPRLAVSNGYLLQAAALAGAGIAQLPLNLCHDDLRAGRLCLLLPGYRLPDHQLHLVYPSRRGMVPAVRALIDYLGRVLPPQLAEIVALRQLLISHANGSYRGF